MINDNHILLIAVHCLSTWPYFNKQLQEHFSATEFLNFDPGIGTVSFFHFTALAWGEQLFCFRLLW